MQHPEILNNPLFIIQLFKPSSITPLFFVLFCLTWKCSVILFVLFISRQKINSIGVETRKATLKSLSLRYHVTT